MDTINYQHLKYFWMAAREGSVTGAAKRLRLAPSTVSTQIKSLEEVVGHALFRRSGRSLALTEHGRLVKEYADDIFALGQELGEVLRSDTRLRHAYRLRVGVASNLPKLVASRLLRPAFSVEDFPVHLVCREDTAATLVADIAVHHLDLVLCDAPVGLADEAHATRVLLGECGVALFATPDLALRYGGDMPHSLDDAPLLLPDVDSAMRRLLEEWFDRVDITPRVVGELDDSALIRAFGREGVGLFPAPSLVHDEIVRTHGVVSLGELPGIHERFYAICAPGRENNPAVRAILDAAEAALDHAA